MIVAASSALYAIDSNNRYFVYRQQRELNQLKAQQTQ
jgi:hypothetical protein